MLQQVALVVDDRSGNRQKAEKKLRAEGFTVETAGSLAEAKRRVLARQSQGGYARIVSDMDLGQGLLQKHRALDGYRFVVWCRKQGVTCPITLHSSAFGRKIRSVLLWPIRKHAERLGITVQRKSHIMAPPGRNRRPK